jgi:ribonuclease HI
MELQAAISALEALKRPSSIEFHTDSQYLRQGITQYIDKWAANNWLLKGGKPVSNADLWQKLWPLVKNHEIEWHWVKGHAGNAMNEKVDKLAREARLEITPEAQIDDNAPKLYVRSSCKGNPGPGGWGVVLEEAGGTEQLSGSEPQTTNNRMEIQAVIEGLLMLPAGKHVQVFTTSDYVFQGATKWIQGWRRRNWMKKDGNPVANGDLWQALDQLTPTYHVHWINAKGQDLAGLDEAGKLAVHAVEVV